ncbi:pentatricopeptide repeat-containing protein At1g06140, mitochondrial-like [Selaginella moellendorffii]|uniref:pentatricopeptide repeat-containing protein At1g06140, mitochondrial-like n=1 Tax=Selaginella moellendorffii TaxID=88036 RepID=UPI000D1D0455|nr:pentatricopeptide repeat-containing protein At1g06140, mitochondrial-like [Selaginella moellendorffii]XP_024539402.1 pentatricopeptide repeat-containing protein At1g06140, mitochondrial-like [Selaginella moellendorffii]|eukprot:XP_024539395.1 pentatricopeptide repeat-containing protein At1g06140, mitochondrial-like [Selaginella moellendorffii]
MVEARVMFNAMVEKDVISWTRMLAAYGLSGQSSLARKTFAQMPGKNEVSWDAMLSACTQAEDSVSVFKMFHTMQMAGIYNQVGFVSALNAHGQVGSVKCARSCFVSMAFDCGIQPCHQHYSSIIDGLARAGYIDNARELIGNMTFVPTSLNWLCLLAACQSLECGTCISKWVSGLASSRAMYPLLANVWAWHC